MPVTTTNLTANFTGDGTTTLFPFTFFLQLTTDLEVFLAGVLQSSGAYTVSINANNVGGTVSFVTAPASGVAIFFERVVPVTQTTNLTNEGEIPSVTLVGMIDRLTTIDQQISLTTSLALQIPASQAGIVNLTLPVPVAGNFLQWNPTGTALVNASFSPTNTLGPGTTTQNAVAVWNSVNGTLLGQVSGTGSSGQVLTSTGAGVPTWQTATTGTIIPAGSVIMFYSNYGGNAIPSGWLLCDGNNNTPNMIGMLPMGSQLSTQSSTPNAAGYGNFTNNSVQGSTTHTHTVTVNGSGSGTTAVTTQFSNVGSAGNVLPSEFHNHTFTVAVTSSGTTASQNILPPASFAIVFIMKT